MRVLYLELGMGASGDMLMGALCDLLDEGQKAEFLEKMNRLGLHGVHLHADTAVKCGIQGLHISVHVHGQEEHSHDVGGHEHGEHAHHPEQEEHGHTGLHEIEHILSHLEVSQKVGQDALAVYGLIANAEAHAHGRPVDQVHFHEVGALDAVADVVGVSLLMEMLRPSEVLASPVHLGSGYVRCAHGVLPVPAPATAHILQGVPVYSGAIKGELCTPTGAALLKHFVKRFGDMPVMRVEKTGYGMGTKDFERANCVRAFLGETGEKGETAAELCCNLDDMTAEAMGYAQELLLSAGALDVYFIPVQMKKGRPGTMLCLLCKEEEADRFAELMLLHTTTRGVRKRLMERYVMGYELKEVSTGLGPVRVKRSEGYGVLRQKPEYEDVAKIAREKGLPFERVMAEILKALE